MCSSFLPVRFLCSNLLSTPFKMHYTKHHYFPTTFLLPHLLHCGCSITKMEGHVGLHTPMQPQLRATCLAELDSVLGAPALCCVNGIALCVSGMGFMWRLCGSVYVRFGPLLASALASAGLPWRPVQPVTQRKPNSARNCPIEAPAPNPHVIDFVAAGAGAGVPSGSCRFGPAKRPASRVCGVMWPTWALCCVMLLTERNRAGPALAQWLSRLGIEGGIPL